MFLVIYNIYIDSVVFIRKNSYVLLPYTLFEVLILAMNVWLPGDSLPERSIRDYALMLIIPFLQMCIVVTVYKNEKIIDSKETLWQSFNGFFGSVLLLIFYTILVFIVFAFILMLPFLNKPALARWIIKVVAFVFVAAFPLSLRHLIYNNNIIVMDSIKAGFKELYKNFLFYLFVALIGTAITVIPSLIFPSSWFTYPFLPLAELMGLRSGNGNIWFRLILDPILLTLMAVALTYAFIFKNKKNKHVS